LGKNGTEVVAIFGGSFDPPHFGHFSVVKEALKVLNIDTLIVVPTFLNPFKIISHFSVKERFELTTNLFSSLERVRVDEYEIKEQRATPTAQTVKHFQKRYSVKYLIIGADNLENIEKWHEFEWLNSQIIWVVATRDGYFLKSDKLRDYIILNIDVNISSTEIRKTIKGKI